MELNDCAANKCVSRYECVLALSRYRPNRLAYADQGTTDSDVAPVVGRELEEKRIEHSFRDRATSAIKLLRNYIGQAQVRDGVTLEFLTDDPTLEYASKRNLNLLLADDRLIVERRCRTCYRNANSRGAKRGAFCTFGSDSAVFNGIESTLMY